ncbi:MAG: hypothetical protein PWP23_1852 [Candidatus Sumerlaeota bacterium]|nr:hypothetical protein [Candidatus Sumerlaeota bacterium]
MATDYHRTENEIGNTESPASRMILPLFSPTPENLREVPAAHPADSVPSEVPPWSIGPNP